MGEVRRARDAKLGRDVAIKVLPDAFITNAERLARFRREAKVLASLHHPHIAAIYGLEESGGIEALVLELVPGQTLDEKLASGPLPPDEAREVERPASNLSSSPTATAGTEAGVILGTASYMSPEQARGKPVDRRTDIWAFGAVLYEMLTGKRAFPGETVSDVLAAILKTEPDWSALPPATTSAIRELLRRCLEKDPWHRLRDIGDARITLEES